jgi:hypothetical protein
MTPTAKRTAQTARQGLSGLGWATNIVGVLLVAGALLQALFQGFGAAALVAFVVGVLLLFVGWMLLIGTEPSDPGGQTALQARSLKRGAGRLVSSLGLAIDAVGVVIFGLGIALATDVRLDLGSLVIMGIGLALLLVGTSAVVAGRRASRRAT